MRKFLISLCLALPIPVLAADSAADVTAEAHKGVAAYNTRDLTYFEKALATDAVYVADDGATFVGKERVLGLFKRIFAMTPPRELAPGDVVVGSRGDVAWARFKWTLTAGPDIRKGMMTTLFARSGGRWEVLQIQNTPDGHATGAHGKH